MGKNQANGISPRRVYTVSLNEAVSMGKKGKKNVTRKEKRNTDDIPMTIRMDEILNQQQIN